ncbi:DegT/DnrJ/EryC1/StrS family aminotransferase [Flavobacterium sp.]|uniref:DegT/DnrJ/EryC1/StrS family aminotransferase n=1 Tax=Flavobacterium sp. TaxID=239 RepID=UPI0038FCD00A
MEDMSPKEDITQFIKILKEKYGYLPKWNHSAQFNGKIFYNAPYFSDEELIEGVNTFLFGLWGASGRAVNDFEKEFCKTVNNKFGVMVNSGSSANWCAIAALKEYYKWEDNITEGIVCSSCFPATAAALIHNNIKPIFIDAELEGLNIDLDLLESKISKNTKFIFLAPTLGSPPDIDRLLEICQKYNLILAGDFCDCLGSTWNNKQLNEYAEISTCSMYVSHHITTCHGGIVTSNNEELIRIARSFSRWGQGCYCSQVANLSKCGQCGMRESAWFEQEPDLIWQHNYYYERVGHNLQPAMDMQGAIGLVQLKKLPEIHQRRKQHKDFVQGLFQKYIAGVNFPKSYDKADVSWFGTGIIFKDYEQKRKVIQYLNNNNIQYREMFTGNLLLHGKYANYGPNYKEFPVSNEIMRRVIFLGCSPAWTQEHLDHIEEVLKNFKNE